MNQITRPSLNADKKPTRLGPQNSNEKMNFKTSLSPGAGSSLQVVVVWKDRVIATHYLKRGENLEFSQTPDRGLFIPRTFYSGSQHFIALGETCRVIIPISAKAVLIGATETPIQGTHSLAPNELLCLSFEEDLFQIYINYYQELSPPVEEDFFDIGWGALLSVSAVLVLVALLALVVSLYTPSPESKQVAEEDHIELIQVRPVKIIPPSESKVPRLQLKRHELKSASKGRGGVLGAMNRLRANGQLAKNDTSSSQLIQTANRGGGERSDLGPSRYEALQMKESRGNGGSLGTERIGGPQTKGRSTGHSSYGEASGSGKTNATIEGNGQQADFIGSIDREAVRKVVRSRLSAIKRCYEHALNTERELEGKIVVNFLIGENGVVVRSKVESSTMENSAVERCVAQQIQMARFPSPPPGTVAEVKYPFIFQQ